MSPSTRRAWIEISGSILDVYGGEYVALHPEGVDRNMTWENMLVSGTMSPSTRRAWIEIALLALVAALFSGRPPPGGRG